jgi:hypothetical protein
MKIDFQCLDSTSTMDVGNYEPPKFCARCRSELHGFYWSHFRKNDVLIGDVCEDCRCALMADYILPMAFRDRFSEWRTVTPRKVER